MMNNTKQPAVGAGMRSIQKTVVALGLSLLGVSAMAQNAIRSVTGTVQSGTEIIRIETTQAMSAVPTGFTIQSPARIALDFPSTINSVGKSLIELNQGNLRSANVVQAGDRTRVVINLKESSTYQAKLEGNTVLIILEGKTGESQLWQPS